MKNKPLYRHPAMRVLRLAIRRELLLQLLLYVCLTTFGGLVAWYFFDGNVLIFTGGLFFFFMGLFYCIRMYQHWPVDRHPVIRLLYQEPEKIVWVYSLVTRRMPYGFSTSYYGLLYFKMLDGEDLCVSLSVRHLRLLSHYLNRLLPHATFGYSPNKEQLYRIDPEMLVQK